MESECVLPHPGAGRATDGGRTRQRHRDGPDGRRGDGHHGDASPSASGASHASVAVRPQRRDPLPASGRGGRGRPRRDRRHQPGGQPPHPDAPADACSPTTRPGSNTSPGPCTSIARGTATPTARRRRSPARTAQRRPPPRRPTPTSPAPPSPREVTVAVQHPEHVKAETVERSPISRSRDETLAPVSSTGQALALSVGADDPFETLVAAGA